MTPYTDFYFDWLNGIGGWVVLAAITAICAGWLIFDSEARQIKATGWKWSAVLALLLFVPGFLADLNESIDGTFNVDQWDFVTPVALIGTMGLLMVLIVAGGYLMVAIPRAEQQAPPPVVTLSPSTQHAPNEPPTIIEAPVVAQPMARPVRPIAYLVDPHNGQQYPLGPGKNRVGRSPRDNDIVLSEKFISRWHALIWEEEGYIAAYDRDSRSGTYVNGRRISQEPHLLRPEDVIAFGSRKLNFRINGR